MNKKNQTKRCKMHVKVGDNIQVISGKDKGKIGEITKIFPKTSQVIIKGTNVKTKHVKPQQEGESGQITTFEAPIHSSSVMLYSSINYTLNEAGKKVRILKKTGEIID